ncbi:MAG: aminoglycoside phosphotransferase family protein [Erysipelotrichaceae bacterium]|nr:aminoglycoside phosphotransferase family protein [Erysipelotrichaceae bacterium]
MNKNELKEIFANYDFDLDQYIGTRMISKGHINTTNIIYFDYGNRVKRYLLQQINTDVFKNPEELMDNINKVSSYCKNLLKSYGINDYKNRIIRIYKTKDDQSYIKTSSGNFYRVYHFVEGGISIDKTSDQEILHNAGRAVGYFQNLLAHFPADTLHETIPFFHDTPYRYQTFLEKLNKADKNLIESCKKEIEFFKKNECIVHVIQDLIDSKKIPLRVTHNDTKLNNIMFDYNSHSDLCLVDLDTVMPGCICFDFGDLVRSACNLGEEDSTNLDDVIFSKETFFSIAHGYLSCVSTSITRDELENLTMGAILMTYECGLRFLTDYLDGNHYFKVDYPTHNLIRARTQIKMCDQILANKFELDKGIMNIYNTVYKM